MSFELVARGPARGAGPITSGSGFDRKGDTICPAEESGRNPNSKKKGLGFLS